MLRSQHKSSVSRDFIVLFAVIMGIIAMVALWVAYKTFENYAEGVVAEMEGEVTRIDRSLVVEIKSASYLLESLARQIVQIGANDKERIARLLGSFNDNNRKDEFSWLNASQQVIVYSSGGVLSKPVDASDRDYVKKAFTAPWQVHIGRPIKGRVTERWVLPLSLGVTGYRGDFIGIMQMSVDIEDLTEELAQITQKSDMEFAIYTRTLSMITDSTSDDDVEYGNSRLLELLNVDFSTSRKGLLSRPLLFQPSRPFGYYEASTQYPYVIYIGYDPVKSDDKIFALMQARLIQILIISVFLLTLLWMVRTRIIRPVEQLCDITSMVSTGEGFRPLPKGGPIEIENLAFQIRKLSDYITEQHRIEQELKLKNHFLMKVQQTAQTLTRARSDFLCNIASDIHKPITQMITNLHYLQQNNASPEYHELIIELGAQLVHLRQVAEDMHEIGEMEYSSILMRDSSVNVAFVLHRALRKFHEFQQYRHVEVKLKADSKLPQLLIDEDRLTQILVNILCGAVASLMQGAAIELIAQTEHNEEGERVLVIQVHYLSHIHAPLRDYEALYYGNEENEKSPRVKSDTTCFALARMLISLYDGDMSIISTKGEMNRVFVRFPAERMMH